MTLSLNLPPSTHSSTTRPSRSPAMTHLKSQTQHALERWRQLWELLIRQLATQSEKSLKLEGMYRNAFKFWVLLQFIIAKEEAVEVLTGMEVNCDDALTKLKVLFGRGEGVGEEGGNEEGEQDGEGEGEGGE